MAYYFIVGAKGERERWLVDTQKRQVQQIDMEGVGDDDESPVVKGIAVAIATENRNGLISHQVAPST